MSEKANNINELGIISPETGLAVVAPGKSPESAAAVVVEAPGALVVHEVPAPRERIRVVDVFLARYANPRSLKTMGECLDRIEKATGESRYKLAWHQLTEPQLALVHARLGSVYSRATVELTMTALHGVMKTCKGLGLMTKADYVNAVDHGRWQGRIPEAPGRALSEAEVGKIAAFCSAKGPYAAFLGGFFAMALGGGLRANELCELPADAYGRDEEGNLGVKVLGKGNKEALQPLSPDEGPAIERWLETRRVLDPSCGRLFPRVRKNGGLRDDALDERAVHYLCATVADAVGIPTFMPHDMRRTFATRLYEAGCSDRTVQLLMRHANAATSRKYDRRGAAQLRTTRLEVTMWPAPKGR